MDGEETDADDDEFAEHLSLRHTRSNVEEADIVVDRPRTEVIAVVVEAVSVLAIVGTYIASWFLNENHRFSWPFVIQALPWVNDLYLMI